VLRDFRREEMTVLRLVLLLAAAITVLAGCVVVPAPWWHRGYYGPRVDIDIERGYGHRHHDGRWRDGRWRDGRRSRGD
jgi:hypothetical protein